MDTFVNTTLVFLHFTGLMLGAAAGLGQMVVARRLRADSSPSVAAMRPSFGAMGLAGIVLLWITGLLLWLLRYDLTDFGPAFHTKLTVAGLLFAIIIVLHVTVHRALARGEVPPGYVKVLGMSTPFLTFAAVALAAYVFQ